MRRRTFIAGLSSAAAWPLVARAQQTATPVIGILAIDSAEANSVRLRAFRDGLAAAGYLEGQNVNIEYRWAEAHTGRLPELAAQLVARHVAVVVAAGGTVSALAAQAATNIPIIFAIGSDPVDIGLVATLNRPGRNMTGVTNLNIEVEPKRVQLLRELIPSATTMGLLVNPTVPAIAESAARVSQVAAHAAGLQLHLLQASSAADFDAVFGTLIELHADALVIGPDSMFTAHSEELAMLTVRHALPTIFEFRRFVTAGGLMSYGSSETEYYRLVGTYTGRILKGDKPTDLPVLQTTKVELMINLKTAKALGITVPLSILARADEVIE